MANNVVSFEMASAVMRAVEKRGGVFSLVAGGVLCENMPRRYGTAVRANGSLILAIVKDREAGRRREQDYACRCPAAPFAHSPHTPRPGLDVWQELKVMIAESGSQRLVNKPTAPRVRTDEGEQTHDLRNNDLQRAN